MSGTSRSPGHQARLLLATALLLVGIPAAAEQGPISVALVLDTSGSLGQNAQAVRGRLAAEVVEGLPPGSQVAVFRFDDRSELVLPASSARDEVTEAAMGLGVAGRFTALHDAIFDASRYLSEVPGNRKAILLVTDGFDENSALTLEDGVDMARELQIPVFTVGVGRVRERVLRRIAKLTGGVHFASATPGPEVVARIVEVTPVTSPAAPAQVAAPPPAAAAAAAQEPLERPLTARTYWVGWIAALLLAVSALIVLIVTFRRRAPATASAYPAGGAELEPELEDESVTLVTRLESLLPSDSPTMVLTLKPLLHVTRGTDSGRLFEVSLESAVSLGRAEGNDIVLQDVAVSSQHCRIRPSSDGGFELFDLKSTNGTWVNERRVSRHKLAAGDSIKVGETILQFRMDHMKGE